jgi:aspartyl/asparaginyl-tRNA synthetase
MSSIEQYTNIKDIHHGMEGIVRIKCKIERYRIKGKYSFILLKEDEYTINAIYTAETNKILYTLFDDLKDKVVEIKGSLLNNNIEHLSTQKGIEIKILELIVLQ